MRRNIILFGIAFLAILAAVFAYFRYQAYHPSTDDAYIQAHAVNVAAKVGGEVINVNAHNDQKVKQGDLLFEVDPTSYELALQAAQAKVQSITDKVNSSQAAITAAKAEVDRAEAQLALAQKNADSILPLVVEKYLSKMEGKKAETDLKMAKSAVVAAQSNLLQLEKEVGGAGANNPALKAANVELQAAELNLKHTKYYAPISGYIANINLHQGSLIAPGQPLFVLIDNSHYWIAANFKETQLLHMKVGEKVEISIDMYPGKELEGVIAGIGQGSGDSFSLLPSQNATGNWVKISQRFPVKIDFINLPSDLQLRVGASCSVKVMR